jgi:polysaccharide deacetylase 2 family uncharacterized protein YibQ
MGSKLTQLTFPMTTLMKALEERQLYFVDSRTTRYTKAHKIASTMGLPVLERKVFLDHELSEEFIQQQFHRLIRLARKYGHAIGIGHPHPLTVNTLKSLIQNEDSVEFVSVDTLIQSHHQPAPDLVQSHKLESATKAIQINASATSTEAN